MPALNERATEALEASEAAGLETALQGIHGPEAGTAANGAAANGAAAGSARAIGDAVESGAAVTLGVGGRDIALPPAAAEAVLDLLQRLAEGHAVVVASTDALLTTSQAAELIGISATYLLRLANNGVIPVQYRGTHRRFALADAMLYLEQATRAKAAKTEKDTPKPAAAGATAVAATTTTAVGATGATEGAAPAETGAADSTATPAPQPQN